MTSSTAHSDRLTSLLAIAALAAAAWLLPVVAFESLAAYAETHWGVFLWRHQEWMELFTPATYVGRGRGRIMVIGPSEAREALVAEPFEEEFPGFEFLNDAISFSTLEDGITQLEYIEEVYGSGAMPELLIFAVTQRYVLGFAPGKRPLVIAINKYSPAFWLDESVEPQRLLPKNLAASLLSRIRLAGHSGSRYFAGIRALGGRIRFADSLDPRALATRLQLVSPRYHFRSPIANPTRYREQAAAGDALYQRLAAMRAEPQAEVIADHFERLREIAARNTMRAVVLIMPEASWRRDFYAEGIYEEYRSVLMRAAESLPVLDLREAMPDERYFDTLHLDRQGADQFSRLVSELLGKAMSPEQEGVLP